MSTKYKFTKMMQVGGDDGYCYSVFVKTRDGWREKVNGCTRREADSYRRQFENEERIKAEVKKGIKEAKGKEIDMTDMRCPKYNRAVHGNDNEDVVIGDRGSEITRCPRCKAKLKRVVEKTDLGVTAYFVDV